MVCICVHSVLTGSEEGEDRTEAQPSNAELPSMDLAPVLDGRVAQKRQRYHCEEIIGLFIEPT